MTTTIKVAEWIRVSDESQAAPEKFGIPAQRSVNLDTCKRYGLEIVKTFQVEDVSGKDILRAPETNELIRLMESGRIQGVVSREFSRLMRPDDFADYVLLSEFQKTKTLLYLPEGSIDFNDKMGRLMAGMQASISGYERSTIRERLYRGNEENRKSGGRFCSVMPKGVGHSKELGWHYNDESKRVREAYDMVLSGETLNEIARALDMTATGVRYLIANPIYKGWRVYERECGEAKQGINGRQAKYTPRRKRSADKVIRVQVIDKPLISGELWERANRVLSIKSESLRRAQQKGRGGIATYNGFLFCDECGRVLTPIKSSPTASYYVCLGHRKHNGCSQGYFRINKVEENIDTMLGEQMTDPAFLRRLAMRLTTNQTDRTRASRIERLEAEQKSLDKKRTRVLDMFEDGDITKSERTERTAKLAEQRTKTNEELYRLKDSASTLDAGQLVAMFQIFVGWDTRPKDDRRKLLGLTIPRMRVRNGEVVSFYRLLDNTEHHVDKKRRTPSSSIINMDATNGKSKGKRMPETAESMTQAGIWINVKVA